jgi:hypothetical protein
MVTATTATTLTPTPTITPTATATATAVAVAAAAVAPTICIYQGAGAGGILTTTSRESRPNFLLFFDDTDHFMATAFLAFISFLHLQPTGGTLVFPLSPQALLICSWHLGSVYCMAWSNGSDFRSFSSSFWDSFFPIPQALLYQGRCQE